ncbi:MAG: DUF1080 domain-containing protein [Planctomycetes bacterium]|nr:DUF1080 domain-containing protein [Planctomycetota bacterium]
MFPWLAVTFLCCSLLPAQEGVPEGFQSFWNGVDLTGFWGLGTEDPAQWMALDPEALAKKRADSLKDIRAHWRVEGKELVNDGHGLYLTTEKNYGDFEFLVEYRTVAKADSGIYLRGIPQVQIWDTTQAGGKWNIGADKGSGGLWNNTAGAPGKDPLVHADRPFGAWNQFRIRMVGEFVSVHLNGKLVVDHARLENYFDRTKPIPREGPIQLQTHGGEIRWRNLFVREIAPDEANAILRAHDVNASFQQAWNGKDWTGWAGPLENYEIVDGAIRCKPGKGGTIYTTASFSDFEVCFQFLLPPGGNNGLAIRYPGQGDTAYVGMCELQVLDNTHPKFARLDPRQYHGSVYGQVAAHRGYLRTPGLWNYQRVVVKGHTIRVELNGTRIVDADLSKITEFMYEAKKFQGRMRTEGHFGFAGHSDPVSFKDIVVRSLD